MVVVLSLLLGTWTLYLPVLWFEFVLYDDPLYVVENTHVLRGLTWQNIKLAFSSTLVVNWHPLTMLSHMFDVSLFGLNAGAHHGTNVILHSANAALLFLVLRQATGAFWKSAAVAALFAWHPTHIESVAWISERKDVLSTLFLLLTWWAYNKFAS